MNSNLAHSFQGNITYGTAHLLSCALLILIPRSVAFYPSRILYVFLRYTRRGYFTYLSCLTAIPTEPNGGNHTPGFTSAAATLEAHEICLEVCKALALTGVRVIGDDQFYTEVNSPSLIAVLH